MKFFESIPNFLNLCKEMAVTRPTPPKLIFHGTVKLHGTNASVVYSPSGGCVARSRARELSPEFDNFGFYEFAQGQTQVWRSIWDKCVGDDCEEPLEIFGEWIGPGIQQKVAVSQIEQRVFVVFEVRHPRCGTVFGAELLNLLVGHHPQVTSVGYFDFSPVIEIDFGELADTLPTLKKFTDQVEASCPGGRALGVDGIGEGVVWSAVDNGRITRFKVKGEAHAKTPVKVITEQDGEVLAMLCHVENVATQERLEQGLEFLRDEGLPLSPTSIGPFVKWVSTNIAEEEVVLLDDVDPKVREKFLGHVRGAAAKWIKERL